MERSPTLPSAVRSVCGVTAHLAAASLCAGWIALRGGLVLGLFPAWSALFGHARAVIEGRAEARVWASLRARAARDFAAANVAGWSAALPLVLAAVATAAAGRLTAPAVALAILGAQTLPVAMAVSAWVALPMRFLPAAPFLLAAAVPHRAALAAGSMAAAGALWRLHPLAAIYFGPALAAVSATAALLPILSQSSARPVRRAGRRPKAVFMASVTLRGIRKSFGTVDVLRGIDLDIASGEFCVFVGPSGCGKSTLLRMIAGLETVTAGEMTIDGRRVNDVPPAERDISMVFQSYALYPHMTVFDNMAFGLRIRGVPPQERRARVEAAADVLQIRPLLDRTPAQLSGGQRQRVAIGRCIVRGPKVFLFDEPLSNLDAALRAQTRVEIGRLRQQLAATMIYVTHDQVEAMTLADTIVVLRDGRVEQVGKPLDLYERPANLFVAGFIGSPEMNFVPVALSPTADGSRAVARAGGAVVLPGLAASGPGTIGVRSEHLLLCDPAGAPLRARIDFAEQLGEYTLFHATGEGGERIAVKEAGSRTLAVGTTVGLTFDVAHAHPFDGDGRRIERH